MAETETKQRDRNCPIEDAWLRGAWRGADEWAKDLATRGSGRLVAKRTRSGAAFYFQYFHAKARRLLPLGRYDRSGARGLTLTASRDVAHGCSVLYRSGTTDLHAHRAATAADERRAREAREAEARIAIDEAARATLRQMLDGYVRHLETKGNRHTVLSVRSLFDSHVYRPFPELAERRASSIQVKEFAALLRRVVEAGKGRTAGALRSYLRAAYALAMGAEANAETPGQLAGFGVDVNPIASIPALTAFNRVRDRVLSADELAKFLRKLDAGPQDAKGDAVRLCLSLGGQRPAQLLRVRPEAIDLAAGVVTLLDSKGRRKQPRRHSLPVTKEAAGLLQRRLDARTSTEAPIFSSDGKTMLRPESVTDRVREIVSALRAENEISQPFQLRDIRRTCETMMAGLGVAKEVRGMIMSHGLGGVQKRHYDFYEYAFEMRRALEKWQRHMDKLRTDTSGNVVVAQFGARRQAK